MGSILVTDWGMLITLVVLMIPITGAVLLGLKLYHWLERRSRVGGPLAGEVREGSETAGEAGAADSDKERPVPFAVQAAKASWVCPLIVWGSGMCTQSFPKDRATHLFIFVFQLLFTLAGIVFGVIALLGIHRHGREHILKPALVGLSLSVLTLLFAIICTIILIARTSADAERAAGEVPWQSAGTFATAEEKAQLWSKIKPELRKGDGRPHGRVEVAITADDLIERGVLTQSLGIETLGGKFTPIIKAGTLAPCSTTEVFSTATDNQGSVEIALSRGNADHAAENTHLGRFLITGIRPMPRGVPQIYVTFTVNENGDVSLAVSERQAGSSLRMRRVETPP